MARVVGVYALVMVGVCTALAFGVSVLGRAKGGDILMFKSRVIHSGYNSTWGIYLADITTGLTLNLVDWVIVSDYTWSLDRTHLARIYYEGGDQTYFEVLDSSWEIIARFSNARGIFSLDWMPNNQTLVFTTWEDEQLQMYSANIYDSQNWQLLMTFDEFYRDLSLSPDGQLWSYMVETPNGGMTLFLMPFYGGESRQVASFMDTPAWSPDSRFIAYSRFDLVGNSEINILNLSTHMTEELVRDLRYPSEPAWSPDGTQLAFIAYDGNDYEIYLMNADGSNVRQVTFNDVDDSQPAWVP